MHIAWKIPAKVANVKGDANLGESKFCTFQSQLEQGKVFFATNAFLWGKDKVPLIL